MSLESLYTRQVQRIASSISNDDSHPLPSSPGRRFTVPRGKTKHYRNSFVPSAIVHLEVPSLFVAAKQIYLRVQIQ